MTVTNSIIIREFGKIASAHGWECRQPEGLIVPYFTTEFNRCVEHLELNHLVNTPSEKISGWYQISPACRTNDMRKVESGWHSTLFEVLALVSTYPRPQKDTALKQLVADSLDFLITGLDLDRTLLRITYFGGGEVIPGQAAVPATEWRELWREAGIPEENLIPVYGPKNYVLFVGDGERCGPKCEVMYRIGALGNHKWLEIGTLIYDDSTFSRVHDKEWRVCPSESVVSGAAFGLERLTAARMDAADLTEIPAWKTLIELIARRVRQPEEAARMMRGDVLVLADQVRACLFLLAAGAQPDQTQRGRILAVMLRRIRRKIATLNVEDWAGLITELEDELFRIYGARYPELRKAHGAVQTLLTEIKWPEGWNPESYEAK